MLYTESDTSPASAVSIVKLPLNVSPSVVYILYADAVAWFATFPGPAVYPLSAVVKLSADEKLSFPVKTTLSELLAITRVSIALATILAVVLVYFVERAAKSTIGVAAAEKTIIAARTRSELDRLTV